MKYLFGIIISYFLLYITIYLHEFGHALFYYKYGCKKNAFHVTVKPTLFFSTPAPVEEEKVGLLSKRENLMVAYGGILINFIVAVIIFLLAIWLQSSNFYIELLLYQFLTLHLAEIVSYMVIGNIYPVSDMAIIIQNEKRLRLPNLLIGLLITIFYGYIFTTISNEVLPIIVAFNAITILCMGIGRVVFTMKYNKTDE